MATPPGQYCDVKLLGLFLAGSFVMRGAGCTINDLWDKDYDRKVRGGKPGGKRGRGYKLSEIGYGKCPVCDFVLLRCLGPAAVHWPVVNSPHCKQWSSSRGSSLLLWPSSSL